MTDQQSYPSTESPVPDLQPITFQPISDDGYAAVYEALVKNETVPGSPVFAVTVTIASSVQHAAGEELKRLIGGMKAAFVLLPELPPDNGGPSDEEPFNIEKQLRIELGVVSFAGPGPVGVALTVETTTGIVPAPTGGSPGGGLADSTVGAYLDDYWQVRPKRSLTATVTPSFGRGTIRNPVKTVFAGPKGQGQLTARQVIVHALQKAMTYRMSTNFFLVKSGV